MNEGDEVANEIEGYIDRIVFRNDDNGYTVATISVDEDEITCVGNFPVIDEGEFIKARGHYTNHHIYGKQLIIEDYEFKEPDDAYSMERYLSSGAIKGIGPVLASRIMKKFKVKTFSVIENEPERLSEVKGVSEKMAMAIGEQFEEKREMRDAMIFLQKYNISGNLAVKIYREYGESTYDVLRENPYQLAEDIAGVGFKTADDIGQKVGLSRDSDFRTQSGILYILMQASQFGHIYLPEKELILKVKDLLMTSEDNIKNQIINLSIEKKIIVKEEDGDNDIYSAVFYYMELGIARMLWDLNIPYDVSDKEINKRLKTVEKDADIELDDLQKEAVIEAVNNGLLVITGGPGTGKTTTINAIIKYFEEEGLDILLAAPTGRAAKKMSETTGYEAKTIHRLLELSKLPTDQPKEGDNRYLFEKNELNPLETDVIIIDEMSMVDISLMNALLKAIMVGTRVILVGDVNQLPSVGAGNILKDIISSERFNVVKLRKIFRQAQDSDIIVNAHKINDGKNLVIDNKSRDFFLLKRDEAKVITAVMINLIKNKLPSYVNATPLDIQVLTPMRKGELGVEKLNQVLQEALNPANPDKKERENNHRVFREGDKVMQIKNNYQIAWEIKGFHNTTIQTGTGIFNGDAGIVQEINLFAEKLIVEFDDKRVVEYSFTQLDELELAYAITIHKSQGSEYSAVVLPILSGPKLLFNRNLLYTAVTRAKDCVTIVGREEMIQFMINNEDEQNRYSTLDQRIQEMV